MQSCLLSSPFSSSKQVLLVNQAGLELTILLQPPKYWDYSRGNGPPCPAGIWMWKRTGSSGATGLSSFLREGRRCSWCWSGAAVLYLASRAPLLSKPVWLFIQKQISLVRLRTRMWDSWALCCVGGCGWVPEEDSFWVVVLFFHWMGSTQCSFTSPV